MTEEIQKPADKKMPSVTAPTEFKQYDSLRPVYLMCIIAIIIAVLALLESAHLSKQTRKLEHDQANHTKLLNEKFTGQTQEFSSLSNQLQQLQTTMAANQLKITATIDALKDLKQARFANNSHWMLTQIKYLLNLAQYNLQLFPAPETALAILQKVNEQLVAVDDPNALPLRQQVINAIAALNALPPIDYAGILMQLNAVGNQLKNMPLLINTATGTAQTLSDTDATKGWRKYWHESLEKLEKIIIIRHQSAAAAPLITPDQQQFLEQNIQARLSAASWALLQRNQKVYILSLQDAINWIQTYYSPNAAATNNAVATLQTLIKINLQPQLPNLSQSIQLTTTLLNNKQPTIKGVK